MQGEAASPAPSQGGPTGSQECVGLPGPQTSPSLLVPGILAPHGQALEGALGPLLTSL